MINTPGPGPGDRSRDQGGHGRGYRAADAMSGTVQTRLAPPRRGEATGRRAKMAGPGLPAITLMRCRSRMKENAGHGGRALRLHVDTAHVRSRRRRCRAGQTRSGQAQGQDNGNDNSSPDAHDSSIAIPDVGHYVPGTQPPATARLPSRGGVPVRTLFMRLFLLLPDTEIC
jgi:hypothetical protein